MQSKNVLWLGVLFIILLTAFCIAKYIDRFHPNIQTVTAPNSEIIDQSFELQPVKITEAVDENYLKVIQLVEQEEKDIEDAYNKALIEEVQKSEQTVKVQKPIIKQVAQKKRIPKKRRVVSKKPKRLSIETILADQTLVGFGKLSYLEKQKLKEIVHSFQKNPSSYLRIETDKKSNKFYSTKRYLTKLGVLQKDIEVLQKKDGVALGYKSTITISHNNHSKIDILLLKKD